MREINRKEATQERCGDLLVVGSSGDETAEDDLGALVLEARGISSRRKKKQGATVVLEVAVEPLAAREDEAERSCSGLGKSGGGGCCTKARRGVDWEGGWLGGSGKGDPEVDLVDWRRGTNLLEFRVCLIWLGAALYIRKGGSFWIIQLKSDGPRYIG